MDFGKFKYQQKKRQHKGHSHQIRIKEIRVRPKTGEHDIEVKVNRAREFLEHKDKVIVTVMFRGRELAHIEEGRRVIDGVIAQLADVSKIEAAPVHHGRRMICTLAPSSAALPASPKRQPRFCACKTAVFALVSEPRWGNGPFPCRTDLT